MIKLNTVNDATPLVDYTYFYIIAERAMKDAHEAMTHKNYDKALEYITLAQVELRMTYNSIIREKETYNGY